MRLSLHILTSTVGSTTAALHNQQAGPLPPQALGNARKEYPLRVKPKLNENNGQTSPSAPATKQSKAVVNHTRASKLYFHIHTHIVKTLPLLPKWLSKRRHVQSFVRPSSLIPLLILGDVGL